MKRRFFTYNPKKAIVTGSLLIISGVCLGIYQEDQFLGYQEDEYYQVEDYEELEEPEYQISAEHFAQEANVILAKEDVPTPLLLQTDEKWSQESYGTDGGANLYENGCAIASLAMVASYQENKNISPTDILQWAENDYYVSGQGTDWRIFPDFANEYHYTFHDLDNDFNQAISYLKKGIPVIVSATPGEFTSRGHIMVLAKMQDELIKVLDPADNDYKNHSYQWYTFDELQGQLQHYWTFTKSTSL